MIACGLGLDDRALAVYRDSLLLSTLLQPFSARGGTQFHHPIGQKTIDLLETTLFALGCVFQATGNALAKLHVSASVLRKFRLKQEWRRWLRRPCPDLASAGIRPEPSDEGTVSIAVCSVRTPGEAETVGATASN